MTNALGCLVADLRQDFVRTINQPLEAADMTEVASILAEQAERGRAVNAAEGDEIVETQITYGADMQFRGQTHLLRVALPTQAVSRADLQTLFEAAYFARFKVELPEIKAQLVNLTTSVVGRRKPFPVATLLDESKRARDPREGAITGERQRVFADGTGTTSPSTRADALPLGSRDRWPRHHRTDRRDDGHRARRHGPRRCHRQSAHYRWRPPHERPIDRLTLAVIEAGLARSATRWTSRSRARRSRP